MCSKVKTATMHLTTTPKQAKFPMTLMLIIVGTGVGIAEHSGYNEQAVCVLIYNHIRDVYTASPNTFLSLLTASILVNCFYFLQKITTLRPSILNF